MIRPIITDKTILAIPSDPVQIVNQRVLGIIKDLQDTANHHQTTKIGCAGLAANQIGHLYHIILVWNGKDWITMINPEWEPRDGKLSNSHEGCLSRPGVNVKVKRHKRIKVWYESIDGTSCMLKVNHLTARIVQHEVDHLNGVFI